MAAAAALLLSGTLGAQDTGALRAATCDHGTAALAAGAKGQAYADALTEVRACGDRTAQLLAAEWCYRRTDAVEIAALAGQSSAVMDRRVADVARAVLEDVGATRALRLGAMAALVGQVAPALGLTFVDTSDAAPGGVRATMLGQRSDMRAPKRGDPSAMQPDSLIMLLRLLARTDRDVVVQRAARETARDLDDVFGQP